MPQADAMRYLGVLSQTSRSARDDSTGGREIESSRKLRVVPLQKEEKFNTLLTRLDSLQDASAANCVKRPLRFLCIADSEKVRAVMHLSTIVCRHGG